MQSALLEQTDTSQHRPLLGLFGGTFDPVHYGHFMPVLQAAKQLGITQVSLIPCHIPPHKNLPKATNKHRLEMLKIVCRLHPLFSVDERELLSHRKSYTVQTLRQLHSENSNHTLCFFIGMDSLLSFTQWYQWKDILQLCHLVVCRRSENIDSDAQHIPSELTSFICDKPSLLHNNGFGKIFVADTTPVNISSTEIRDKHKVGENFAKTMPQEIIDYIDKHQLYR